MTYLSEDLWSWGYATLEEIPEGVMVTWDNGLRIRLQRRHAAELAEVLAELVERRGWS